ncbi:Kelch repeat-containing protein [Thermoproteota archaeon]
MKEKIILFLFFFGLLVTFPNVESVWATKDSEDPWLVKAPMHEARSNFGVAVVDGKIYAIGGALGGSNISSTNEMYDPVADMWTFKRSMPTARAGFAVAVYQDKIYCIGGSTPAENGTSNIVIGKVEVYDPVSDNWVTITSLPTPRIHLQANVVNDKIYVTGGRTYDIGFPDLFPYSNLTEVYDPISDSWDSVAQMPNETSAFSSVVVDDKLYVVGGQSIRIYDPEIDGWSLGAPSPLTAVYAFTGATTGIYSPKRIYVFGADASQNGLWPITLKNYTAQSYDPQTNKWTVRTSMPTKRMFSSVAILNDKLYVIGGVTREPRVDRFYPSTPRSSINEQYDPTKDVIIENIPEIPSWIILPLFLTATLVIVFFRKSLKKRIKSGNYL